MLGRENVQEIAVLPIAIQGRMVGLLYADNGAEALADASFAALEAVCTRLAKAYERLILARKRDSFGASAFCAE
jgi:GAF domain-containing protein